MANIITERVSKKKVMMLLLMITIGAFIMAFTIDSILIPYKIIDGGITGISMIISELIGIKLGILIFLINIPFVYLGYKKLGKLFTLLTIYAIASLSVFTTVMHNLGFTVEGLDVFLACVIGGLGLGLGIGLVLKNSAAIDGVDVLAVIISKKTNISVGNVILVANVFIFAFSTIAFSLSTAFYSIITYYIAKTVLDLVVEGGNQSKTFMISSDRVADIGIAIKEELDTGYTMMKTVGGHTNQERYMLYIAVNKLEEAKLKRIIQVIDPSAFYVVGVAQEHRAKTVKKDFA